ncbi:MAG: sulfatase-like hydrolase/transferase [Armatimonadota bacterium]|nr:MAG: sulfatase-like hydrolase/transferase [Armatimonadota bacterium]
MSEPRARRSARGKTQITRRQFLQQGAAGAGMLLGSMAVGTQPAPLMAAPSRTPGARPNFLIIMCDQLGLDAVGANGGRWVRTPNMDRLAARGVSFMESYSPNPVCSPARSSLLTGRMPVETGVTTNIHPVHPDIPNMGQWLSNAGYDTVYCGKWHLPQGYAASIDGFTVLPTGGGQGDLVDTVVSRTCEAYLKSRPKDRPFLLVASLLQPHDICYWAIRNDLLVPDALPFPQLAAELPGLPENLRAAPTAPKKLTDHANMEHWSDQQWRYYNYIYNRQVEMVDADVGRILDALEDAGAAANTLVMLTADHGDGRGRHGKVSKWTPYDESAKVPLIASWPGRAVTGAHDHDHLVCGLDLMSTVCDCAGVDPPVDLRGRSLRPLLEGKPVQWREFVVVETQVVGRAVRTPRYKYVVYEDDPVQQLFDMRDDPWETRNLIAEPGYADVVRDHRKRLKEWQAGLKPVERMPNLV